MQLESQLDRIERHLNTLPGMQQQEANYRDILKQQIDNLATHIRELQSNEDIVMDNISDLQKERGVHKSTSINHVQNYKVFKSDEQSQIWGGGYVCGRCNFTY